MTHTENHRAVCATPDTLSTNAPSLAADGLPLREAPTNGPRDMLVWAGPQSVALFGQEWAMGGFRRFGKYTKSYAPVFPAPAFQSTLSLPQDLAHGMAGATLNNWYATFAVANDGDSAASFKIAPFLFVKSVSGNECTLGRCGEVADVNVIDSASYSWGLNALAGTDVLVINEVFLSGTPSWTMRVAKVTANTATSVTLDTIGAVGPKCFLLPAPAGWDHYRYCATFYVDTAEVRNFFDAGAGPTRSRMAGTNVVYAHGNNGTHSTYLDGPAATGTKRIDLSRFVSPLATGVFLQSGYMLASSAFPTRAEMYFDMDGGIHTPEVHTFQKDSAEMQAVPLTVFLTFRGGQFYFPSTGGNAALIARVDQTVTGFFEP